MSATFLKNLLAATLLAASFTSHAEDIDLFVGTPPSSTDVPNVLIVLDNTGNWSTPFSNEMAALSSVVSALPADKFRVGLMMYTESGGGNSGSDGGYVRAAIRLLDSATKLKYQALVNSFDSNNDKGNAGKSAKAMAEAYRYFSAGAPYAGNNKNKTDYMENVYNPNPAAVGAALAPSRNVWALPGNALSSKDGTPYANPIISGCAKNFIIFISNGANQDSNSDTEQAEDLLVAAGGSKAVIPISPSGSQGNALDEWVRFMKKSNLGITTYTVDINKVTTGQGPGWTALLKSAANVSDGKYFDVTSSGTQIADALKTIFSEIQSVNSVFASVSLPVSVNTQGTYLNQVFIGMFRPDQDSFPRWAGNLKQYKLGRTDGVLKLQDASSKAAINSSTNFITECARSFWTPTTVDNYWAFKPQGACLEVANSDVSNYPDGNVVEKGGQGYLLRSTTTRTVKTCDPAFAACTSLTNFDTANAAITSTLLGAADSTERDAVINWARGLDVNDEDTDALTVTEMRPSAHGDVVHSRPVAINYGTEASPQVVVFYGGNDGVLRAINGNRSSSIGSVTAGKEFWSFIPPEFYGNIKRIRDNTTTISYPGHTTGTPTPQPKAYGIDGPISAFKGDIGGTDKTFIYAGMRRGGRALYAFDVTDPASPSLKWKKGCPNLGNDTGCTADLEAIGQTWSSAQVLKSAGYGSGASPMLIIGGGYDSCEDTDNGTVNHSCTSSSKGNKIYVLDADSGALLKTLDTVRSVVGDVTVVPDSSGLAVYAYAADMGGNIYRITIGADAPEDWGITTIASLGCDTTASCATNRKFMFGPEVVLSGGAYFLQVGSGDREKPLTSFTAAAGVTNYFFNLKDQPTDTTWLSSESTTCSTSVICLNSLLPITTSATPTQAELNAKPKGWYLGLAATEQVVTSAVTVFGQVAFNTHQPTAPVAGRCTSLGTNRAYSIAYTDASNPTGERFITLAGGGLSPSPVAGTVQLDDGTEVPFICMLDCFEPDPEFSSVAQPKNRVFWNIEQ
ncbi:pilus assembly protein PilY [Pseudomonas cavernae]|uniref:Pilus assembly protein PilY n=1 Tax=Pseudomonas cavernae TaxID=2320867 RepID=A0A385Z9E0_9PSED|nr:PilC/PilY family type IV pilus protein [Pseudomonas cavernae]AYC34328.1 pilus assembly protein PilY [Pseudomonas cavernae]